MTAVTAAALPGSSFSQFTSLSGQKYLQENLPLLSSCLRGKARELDDGHLDATAIASACQKVEFDRYAGYAKIRQADPVLMDSSAAQQMLKNLGHTAAVVLKGRAAKAGQLG